MGMPSFIRVCGGVPKGRYIGALAVNLYILMVESV